MAPGPCVACVAGTLLVCSEKAGAAGLPILRAFCGGEAG